MFKYILKNYTSLLQLWIELYTEGWTDWKEKNIKVGYLWWWQIWAFWVLACQKKGYESIVFSAEWPNSPAAQLTEQVQITYENVKESADIIISYWVDVIIPEWENPPKELLEELEKRWQKVACWSDSFWKIQHRAREKEAIIKAWAKVVDYVDWVNSVWDIEKAYVKYWPWIIKTARFGYDSKGQHRINTLEDIKKLAEDLEDSSESLEMIWKPWIRLGEVERIYEKKVKVDWEISVAVWRNENWEMCVFDPAFNIHENGILKTSTIPAWENDSGVEITKKLVKESQEIAKNITENMWIVWLLVVEMFIVDGELVVNEMAPRGHNSYHNSEKSHNMSQYDVQLETIVNDTFSELKLLKKAVLTNMLWGEINQMDKRKPNKWYSIVSNGKETWYDYWKDINKPDSDLPKGRKMWQK